PDDLHCHRKGVVEQPHQDRKNETQHFVGGERDYDEWDNDHIVEVTAKAALLGPCRMMIVGHGATVPAEYSGSCRLKLADLCGPRDFTSRSFSDNPMSAKGPIASFRPAAAHFRSNAGNGDPTDPVACLKSRRSPVSPKLK